VPNNFDKCRSAYKIFKPIFHSSSNFCLAWSHSFRKNVLLVPLKINYEFSVFWCGVLIVTGEPILKQEKKSAKEMRNWRPVKAHPENKFLTFVLSIDFYLISISFNFFGLFCFVLTIKVLFSLGRVCYLALNFVLFLRRHFLNKSFPAGKIMARLT